MTRLGYGPDKRLAIKVAARNIPTYRDPAVILIDQLPGAGSVGGRARQPRGKRSRGRRGHRRSPPRQSRARRTVVRAGRRRNRRQPRPHQRVVDRGGNQCISGPTVLTARSKMFSIYRIRWRRASRGSSSRNCRRPRPPVRRAAGPAISALTISICAPMRCPLPTSYGRRWRCLRRPSPATRITAPPLGLRLPTSDRKPQRPPIAETKPHGDGG
jgi:hypothetical protein